MDVRKTFDAVASRWSNLVGPEREILLVVSLALSSLISFMPFARETSFSNFFIYALVPIVLVVANRRRFEAVHSPDGTALVMSVCMLAGSFAFNIATGFLNGNFTYGLTDYVLLVIGIFSLYYSIWQSAVQLGIFVLLILRGATLAISVMYSAAFESVSNFLVDMVVALSKVIVSGNISRGIHPGEIIVGGASGGSSVYIGWACAGLEELVVTTVILYVLIDSFALSRKRTTVWLVAGIIGSFFVNVFRMVILVWVAYSRGMDSMLWVHTHLGDALFLIWIAIFWVVFFRIEGRRVDAKRPGDGEGCSSAPE